MRTANLPVFVTLCALGATVLAGCNSRSDTLAREMAYEKKEGPAKTELPPDVPPHPTAEKLRPVLEKIYSQSKLPDVLDADIETGGFNYELTPGVRAVIRLSPGLSLDKQARALVMAVAEADGWAYRPDARRPYADLIHRVKRGYGDDQKELILKAYADLKLMTFFNGPAAQAAVDALPGDVKGSVSAMMAEYTGGKDKVWDRWMGVKMYARRVVAGQEPFRSVLRDIRKELGKEEPPPRTWADSQEGVFKQWAEQVAADEVVLTKVLNMTELRQREEFLADTHSVWAVQGSALVPPKAKGLVPDKSMGFAAMREDLGGGYNEMSYVFSKGLGGAALKKAWLRSIIYGSLLSDFQMLATAGSDFAVRDADNRIDPQTSVVPDKYDPLYARCASEAAVDTFVAHYGHKHAALAGMSGNKNAEAVLDKAHKCIIAGAAGDIYVPPKKSEVQNEGPAPGSRLAIYQMLARFENVDVDLARMGTDVRTKEDDVIDEGEAILKKLKEKENAGKGVK